MNQWIHTIGGILIGYIIIYWIWTQWTRQHAFKEGMQSNSNTTTTTSSTTGSATGEAGSSASYVAALKAQVVQIQDELLISKYRGQYEDILISLDDYLSLMMLKQALNMNLSSNQLSANQASVANLSQLKQAKDTLNVAMAYLDKH